MDKPTINGKKVMCGVELPDIVGGFGPSKKSLLIKHIAEMHGKKTLHVNEIINTNRGRFNNQVDLIDLKQPGFEEFVIGLVDNNFLSKMEVSKAECLFLASERGYAKLIKIFDDDVSWGKYDEILDGYFRRKDSDIDVSKLPPEMQMFKQIWDGLARTQIEQHETQQKLAAVESTVTTIKETFLQRDEDWRTSINSMLNAAVTRTNGDHREIRSDSYQRLEERAGTRLNVKLTNLKKRLEDSGATKTRIREASKLDIIEEDKRLKEIYTTIVKELSIGSL